MFRFESCFCLPFAVPLVISTIDICQLHGELNIETSKTIIFSSSMRHFVSMSDKASLPQIVLYSLSGDPLSDVLFLSTTRASITSYHGQGSQPPPYSQAGAEPETVPLKSHSANATMASNPSTTTIIICAVVVLTAVVGVLLTWYWFLNSRKRRKLASRTSRSAREPSYGPRISRDPDVSMEGLFGQALTDFLDDPPAQRELPNAYMDPREPPYQGTRSQEEEEEYAATRWPSASRQIPLYGRQNTLSGGSPQQQQQQDYRSTPLTLDHGVIREIDNISPAPISSSVEHQEDPISPQTSTTSLPPTPLTPLSLSTRTPIDSSLLYHSHLHRTLPTTHLHVPPRHRLPNSRRSSLITSSAGSETTLSHHVNPAYAATERDRLAACKGRKRRWTLLGLGSEGSSAGGSGWVIKGRSPELPRPASAGNQGNADEDRNSERLGDRAARPERPKARPPPLNFRRKSSLKRKASARPTHPATAGTPALDTISDAPRWAPRIRSIQRPVDLTGDGGDLGFGDIGVGDWDELPDVFGRGAMTDQYFVRERDDESIAPTPKEGRRRGAVRVDGRGRIVRA